VSGDDLLTFFAGLALLAIVLGVMGTCAERADQRDDYHRKWCETRLAAAAAAADSVSIYRDDAYCVRGRSTP
jgi:hypothetical protein